MGPARAVGLGRAHVAGRVVREGPLARRGRPGHADHRHVRGAGRARRARHAARRSDHHRPRHRGAEAALPARHRHRQEGLVPAVQRAGRGLRPRRAEHPRRARRRRVGRERPEGVDLGRALVRSRHAARPHRSRRRQAPGHHLLRTRHAPARRRDPPATRAHRAGDVQRGLPHRRARPERRRHRRPQQRLGGRQHDADVRAQRARRRRGRRRRGRAPGNRRRRPRPPRRRLPPHPRSHQRRWWRVTDVGAEPHRAGPGQRHDRRRRGPSAARAALHPERDRPVHEPAPAGAVAQRAASSPVSATSRSCR